MTNVLQLSYSTNPPCSYRVGVQYYNNAQIVHRQLNVSDGSFDDIPNSSGGTDIAAAVK